MADRRAKGLCSLPPQERRRRRRRQQINLNMGRPPLMSHRLPDVHLHPPPTPLHPLANLPIPLPLHRSHPRLRPHYNPPPHGSSMVRNMALSPSRDLERRPDLRQEHSHHLPVDRFSRRQRHRWRHDERGSEVLWHVPHAHGSCLGLSDHRRLGRKLFHPADGQAFSCYCDLQRYRELRFDLWDLLLSW